jgi:hypothetical protein
MIFRGTVRTMPLSAIVRYEHGKPPYGPFTASRPILSVFLRGGECVQFAVEDLVGTVRALDNALTEFNSSN